MNLDSSSIIKSHHCFHILTFSEGNVKLIDIHVMSVLFLKGSVCVKSSPVVRLQADIIHTSIWTLILMFLMPQKHFHH